MHDTQAPRPRLNIVSRAARTKRIFARMREGWAYDEIARDEGLSAERVRQIVAEVLGKRVIERGSHHAHLQLERLMPALRLAGEAIARGDIKAIAPLIKVIDRMDRHQETVVAKHSYGPEERDRLLGKLSRVTANLAEGTSAPEAPADGVDEQTPPIFPPNPLKNLYSDKRLAILYYRTRRERGASASPQCR
jgi:hypothetical protein